VHFLVEGLSENSVHFTVKKKVGKSEEEDAILQSIRAFPRTNEE
jgi:hypothetical protein